MKYFWLNKTIFTHIQFSDCFDSYKVALIICFNLIIKGNRNNKEQKENERKIYYEKYVIRKTESEVEEALNNEQCA